MRENIKHMYLFIAANSLNLLQKIHCIQLRLLTFKFHKMYAVSQHYTYDLILYCIALYCIVLYGV